MRVVKIPAESKRRVFFMLREGMNGFCMALVVGMDFFRRRAEK